MVGGKKAFWTIAQSVGLWSGFELLSGRAMGEKTSVPQAIARAIPWVIAERAVPWLMRAALPVGLAVGGIQMSWETGRANIEFQKNFKMTMYQNNVYVDTQAAATMRQRAVSVMQGTQMALRSVFQNEGRIMHQRLNPY